MVRTTRDEKRRKPISISRVTPNIDPKKRNELTAALLRVPEGWEGAWKKYVTSVPQIINAVGDLPFYPLLDDLYKAYDLIEPKDVKVIIVGQDPYPTLIKDEDGNEMPRATGLSFSQHKGDTISHSLKNIYQEIRSSIGETFAIPNHGDLTKWCSEGVMLLNRSLMVRTDKNHNPITAINWDTLMDATVSEIFKHNKECICVMWGNQAQTLEKKLPSSFIKLKSGHPSPLARSAKAPFAGCDHFKIINEILGYDRAIDWNVDYIFDEVGIPVLALGLDE